MRKGQGLPVNMIVLTALALLVLVVVGAFFISGFGQASSSVTIIKSSQAQCQGICQELTSTAFNYDECVTYTNGAYGGIGGTTKAKEHACTCEDYGACTVTLKTGKQCSINGKAYDEANTANTWEQIKPNMCQEWKE